MGLVFGKTREQPLQPQTIYDRARRAWKTLNEMRVADELEPFADLTPHDCRHTYASMMIAAGVNAKALSTYMGHANISITLDRYGHLMPGNEGEAVALFDAYLSASTRRAAEQARAATGTSAPL